MLKRATPAHDPWLHSVLVLSIGILVCYSVLILWPAYTSGIGTFADDPTHTTAFQDYHVWYIREWTSLRSWPNQMLDMVTGYTFFGVILMSWYLLLPLG